MARSRKSPSRSGSDSLACPRCARTYGLDERFCAHCGMPLVYAGARTAEPETDTQERARKVRPELTRGELVRVAWSRNQAEAELIQNILLEEGVPSIARRSAGADVPDFLAAGPRDVLVAESGLSTALEALHKADVEPSRATGADGPTGKQAARLVVWIAAGAGVAALIAWALANAA